MLKTISRVQGDSIVVTLPSNNGEIPDSDKEYIVVYTKDGTIILVPSIEYPFWESGKRKRMI